MQFTSVRLCALCDSVVSNRSSNLHSIASPTPTPHLPPRPFLIQPPPSPPKYPIIKISQSLAFISNR